MERPVKFKCDSCTRYEIRPLWGHNKCSAHRTCCKNNDFWNPNSCKICENKLSLLELASNEARESSIEELLRMLERTQTSKAKRGIKNWRYQTIMNDIINLFSISGDIHNNASTSREEGFTPASETRAMREYSLTPMSTENSIADNSPQESIRESAHMSEINSVIGSNARVSVQEALDEQTREHINHGLQLEQGDLRYTLSRREVPNFETVRSDRMSRRDQFENSRMYIRDHDIARTNNSNSSRNTVTRKRKLPQADDNHEYRNGPHQYIPEGYVYNDIYRGEDGSDTTPYENESASELYGVEDEDNQDLNDYQPLVNNEPFEFDEQDHLPWFRFNPKVHSRIDDKTMSVPTAKGPMVIEVFFKPSDPTFFRPKCKSTKIKNIPYFLGTGHSNMLLKAHKEITSSEVQGPNNKEITLLDSNIKSDSRMSYLCEIFSKSTSALVQATAEKNKKNVRHCFPHHTFSVNTLINFNQGWTLNGGEGKYSDWAKDENLKLEGFTHKLNILNIEGKGKTKLTLPPEALNRERETRRVLASLLSAAHVAELDSDKLNKLSSDVKVKNNITPDSSIATARLMTPAIQYVYSDWVEAKIAVRKALVSNTSLESVVWLIKSNPWTPDIFPQEALEEIRSNKFNNQTRRILGLDDQGYVKHRNDRPPPKKRSRYDNHIHYQRENRNYDTRNQIQWHNQKQNNNRNNRPTPNNRKVDKNHNPSNDYNSKPQNGNNNPRWKSGSNNKSRSRGGRQNR